jgi:hypothetical protein
LNIAQSWFGHIAWVEVVAIAPLERAGDPQHRGDAFATVAATFTASLVRFGFVPTHAMEHPNTKSTSGSGGGLAASIGFCLSADDRA